MFEIAIPLVLLYIVCLLVWVCHHGRRYKSEINDPWTDAIAQGNWQAHEAFKKGADEYLRDFKFGIAHFSPLHWIRTWKKKYV